MQDCFPTSRSAPSSGCSPRAGRCAALMLLGCSCAQDYLGCMAVGHVLPWDRCALQVVRLKRLQYWGSAGVCHGAWHCTEGRSISFFVEQQHSTLKRQVSAKLARSGRFWAALSRGARTQDLATVPSGSLTSFLGAGGCVGQCCLRHGTHLLSLLTWQAPTATCGHCQSELSWSQLYSW